MRFRALYVCMYVCHDVRISPGVLYCNVRFLIINIDINQATLCSNRNLRHICEILKK